MGYYSNALWDLWDGSVHYLNNDGTDIFMGDNAIWLARFNSLVPGKSGCDLKNFIFSLALLIDIFKSLYDNALWCIPWNLTDQSTLVQVMAWCHQATTCQAITWSNVDPYLCHCMASLGHNELISFGQCHSGIAQLVIIIFLFQIVFHFQQCAQNILGKRKIFLAR